MVMVVCWLVGVVAWLVCTTVAAGVIVHTASVEQLSSFDGVVLWYGSSGFLCALLAAAVAALAHRGPHRDRWGRDAVASLGGPVAALVANAVLAGLQPATDWGGFLVTTVLSLAGAVAGWQLGRALRPSPGSRLGG
ncbi:hypothetical protein JCM3263A_02460 [Thermobifida fusca]